MSFFLIRSTATPETWAGLIANPEDRRQASENAAALYGGKIHGYWYALGEYDVYGVFEAPDASTAAMLKAAVSAGGAYSRVEVVPLLSVEEMLDALKRAQGFPYHRPGEPPPGDGAQRGSGESAVSGRR